MEGRYPKGMVLAFVNCTDAATEAEMNDWYDSVHVPDITRPGLVTHATRWVNPAAKDTPEDPKYLAMYECEREDVAAAWAENLKQRGQWHAWKPGAPIHPALKVVKVAVFRRTGAVRKPPTGRRSDGVLVALTDCSGPAREPEFNRFYDEVHVPGLLATGVYWSAMRYVNATPGRGEPKYLALYETDRDGPSAFAGLQGKLDRSQITPLSATKYVAAFNLLFSQEQVKASTARARA